MALSLGETWGHRTLRRRHRTLNPCVRCFRNGHVSPFESHASESNGAKHRTWLSCHRTRRYSPDLNTERFANSRCHRTLSTRPSRAHRTHTQRGLQNARTSDAPHQTHLERPVLSVRFTRRSQIAQDARTGVTLHPVLTVRCLTLAEPSTTVHRTRRLSIRCFHGQRSMSVSQRETLPRLLHNFPPAQ